MLIHFNCVENVMFKTHLLILYLSIHLLFGIIGYY
jgi:hypothetical protein